MEVNLCLKRVNPYLRDELSVEAVAHKCGCRCRKNTDTVGGVIQLGLNNSTCAASCIGSDNYNANISEARADKKW